MSARPDVLRPRSRTARENWALMALTLGLITGPVGLALGWWLTLTSRLWTTRQKIVAALAVPIPIAAGISIIVHTVVTFTMEDNDKGYYPPWAVGAIWVGFLSLFIVPVGLAVYLSRAASIRALGMTTVH